MMIESLRALFLQLFENSWSKKQWENEDSRLPTAALLVRVATVNGEMSQARRVKLHAVLKSNFGLDYLTASKLIDGAATAERSAIDLYYFTRQLNEVVDAEGRRKTVEMMWEIIYVDGNVNESEVNIIWRASDLLGVSSRERIALRQRVAASKAVFVRSLWLMAWVDRTPLRSTLSAICSVPGGASFFCRRTARRLQRKFRYRSMTVM